MPITESTSKPRARSSKSKGKPKVNSTKKTSKPRTKKKPEIKPIPLFHVPSHRINTSEFGNLLHDDIVTKLEEEFAEYVGATHACAVRTATDAIFLSLLAVYTFTKNKPHCTIPSMVTTRFLNAVISSGATFEFTDDTTWVGHYYKLLDLGSIKIYDSAQMVEPGQFGSIGENDILIYSFYPTKPIGGLQGGMICSHNQSLIDWIRKACRFGEDFTVESWKGRTEFVGYQMFMDAVNARIAYNNFLDFPEKRKKLERVQQWYLEEMKKADIDDLVLTQNSTHLFRIWVPDVQDAMERFAQENITTGHHYKPAHLDPVYALKSEKLGSFPDTSEISSHALSIPFHVKLTKADIKRIVAILQDIIPPKQQIVQ